MALSSPASDEEGTGVLPVFVKEPDEEYYIVRGRSVELSCKATNAVQMLFKCVGHWVVHGNEELVDPHTGVNYLQNTIHVEWAEVEDYFGDYWCECHAFNTDAPNQNEPKEAVSRRGYIRIACKYLQFSFFSQDGFINDDGLKESVINYSLWA